MTQRKLYHLLWILLPVLLPPDFLIAQQSHSETDGHRRKELVRLRKDFFAQELGLTADEATYLDHILRETNKKQTPLWRELREQYELAKSEALSGSQATKCLQREQRIKSQLAEMDEQVIIMLRKQIPACRLVNYLQVQREFARKYIECNQLYHSDRR